jgi:predicted HAD superfamily Cof-like phosphohydrolase
MKEENDEYLDACYKKSLVEIADALGDQLYILCGTILKHGMQHIIEDVFNEIQDSNMSKLGEDGKPVLRADGKILKGPGYFRPNINKFLEDASSSVQESID